MKKLLFILLLSLSTILNGKQVQLELFETDRIKYKNMYDFLLPYFIKFVYTSNEDPLEQKITALNDFLWTWNKVKGYEDFYGLGSMEYLNTANILAFDKMYCSEIDMLAALPFRITNDIARLDVTHHTLFEVYDKNKERWIIVDPYKNAKIKNSKGQLITFEEMKRFYTINTTSRLNGKELDKYVELFLKDKHRPQSKESFVKEKNLRKTTFGNRKIEIKFFSDEKKIQVYPLQLVLREYEKGGVTEGLNQYIENILLLHHIPFFYNEYINQTKKELRKLIWQVQDILLKNIKRKYYGRIWNKDYYTLWEARQYQILGRFDKAKEVLDRLYKNNYRKKQVSEYINIGKKLRQYIK